MSLAETQNNNNKAANTHARYERQCQKYKLIARKDANM